MNIHQSFVGCSRYTTRFRRYSNGDLVEFDGVMYNDGGHYLPELNRFVCNTTGVYYITVNYYDGFKSLYQGVTLNTLTVLHSSHPYAMYNTFSNSRLLKCEQNDTIMVRATGNGYLYGSGIPLTTFSVMLIYDEGIFVVFVQE